MARSKQTASIALEAIELLKIAITNDDFDQRVNISTRDRIGKNVDSFGIIGFLYLEAASCNDRNLALTYIKKAEELESLLIE